MSDKTNDRSAEADARQRPHRPDPRLRKAIPHAVRLGGWAKRHPRAPLCVRLLFSRFSPGERDLTQALIFLAAGVLVISLLLAVFIQLPQVPFNVREMFADRYLLASLPLFAAFLIWTSGIPNLMARVTIICPLLHLAQPIIFLLMALPSWWMLSLAVSNETLVDVLGAPVLGWPGNWELAMRYLALVAPFLLSLYYWNLLLEGSAWLNRQFGLGQLLAAVFIGLPLFWLSKYVAVDKAATQNIMELTASGPSWKIGGLLALAVALASLNGVLLAWVWLWDRQHQIAVLIATPVLLLTSWWLLNQGLTAEAVSFLLGPDYGYKAGTLELLLRWTLVYVGAVGLVTFAHLIPFRLRGSGASQREALSTGTFPHIRRDEAA